MLCCVVLISKLSEVLTALKHRTYLSPDLRKGELSQLRLSLQEENISRPICAVTLPNVRVQHSDSHIPSPGDAKGHGTSPKKNVHEREYAGR